MKIDRLYRVCDRGDYFTINNHHSHQYSLCTGHTCRVPAFEAEYRAEVSRITTKIRASPILPHLIWVSQGLRRSIYMPILSILPATLPTVQFNPKYIIFP